MANPSYKPKAQETSVLLKSELRRRGMSNTAIESALKKKKRRKLLEFNAVKSRHFLPMTRKARSTKPARSNATLRPPTTFNRESQGRISDELCTVEFAARQLKLHNKTLLRFIRDGRLRATRVGKSYRILRADLEAFAGLPAEAVNVKEKASLTSIVDIPHIPADAAQRIARNITAALNSKQQRGDSLRADVVHDIERSRLKVVVVGSPTDAVNLLNLIRIWMDQ
jgi:excisionase family DNA binding protein